MAGARQGVLRHHPRAGVRAEDRRLVGGVHLRGRPPYPRGHARRRHHGRGHHGERAHGEGRAAAPARRRHGRHPRRRCLHRAARRMLHAQDQLRVAQRRRRGQRQAAVRQPAQRRSGQPSPEGPADHGASRPFHVRVRRGRRAKAGGGNAVGPAHMAGRGGIPREP